MGKNEELYKNMTDTQYITTRDNEYREKNKYDVNSYGGKQEADQIIKRYQQYTTLTEEEIETIQKNVPPKPDFKVLDEKSYNDKWFLTKWKYNGKVKSYKKARKAHFLKADDKKNKNAKDIKKYIQLRRKLDRLVDDAEAVKEYQKQGFYNGVKSNMEAIQAEYDKMADMKNGLDYQKAENELSGDDWKRVEGNEDFKKAITSYTGMGFGKINGILRRGGEINTATAEGKHITAMDKVFNKIKINRDLVVRRGVGNNSFKIFAQMLGIEFQNVEQLRKAVTQKMNEEKDICISDKGYMSTSLPYSGAKFGAGGITGKVPGVEFVILVHKGTKAINVSHNSDFQNEKELLINRGTKFRIVGAKMEEGNKPIFGAKGSWTIYLETVPSSEEGIKKEAA